MGDSPTETGNAPHGPDTPGNGVAHFLFGRFRLDVASRQLLRDDEVIALSAKAWDTLHLLVTHRHRVVGKEELLSLIWPQKTVSEDLLPQNILAIRRALGDDSGQPRFVATTPRRGYRFVAAVTVLHANGTSEATRTAHEHPEAGHARLALDANGEAPSAAPRQSPTAAAPPKRRVILTVLATAAVLVVVGLLVRRFLPPAVTQPTGRQLRFTQSAPAGATFASGGVLSPDGKQLAFVAQDEGSGEKQLWLRTLDATDAHAISGTEDASLPFWSPDSQSLGFFARGKLKRVGLGSDPPQTIADVGLTPGGGAWSPRNTILFARWKAGISSVADTGGRVTEVTTLNQATHDAAHQRPQFLPDGRHFLYYVRSSNTVNSGTYVGAIDTPDRVRLTDAVATYASPGYLLTVRDGVLMAEGFDTTRLRLTGNPTRVTSDLQRNAAVSAAGGDLLAIGGYTSGSRLLWFDRAGTNLGKVDASARLHNLAFSADLKQLLASSSDAEQRGVWMIDLERGGPVKFAPEGSSPWASPDGQWIVYTSDRAGGVADVYRRSATGRGEELLLQTPENKIVNDWSPDGRYIVFVSTNPSSKKDLWLLPQSGNRKPTPYLQTAFNEIQGQVSPDGRWMAYASDESGTWQVYVQSFPMPGRKRAISVAGGAQPRWRHDGRELFYLAPDHSLMAVDVTLGEVCDPGRPHALFKIPIFGNLNTYRSHYAVTADGQRFLVDSLDGNQRSITLIFNWNAPARP